MAIVTLAEAKEQLRISPGDTGEDQIIQAYCDGITQVIEDYKREVIEQRTVHEDVEHYTCFGRRFRLWEVPVISLTSVESVVGERTWDVAHLRPNTGTGLVRVLAGPPVRGLVEVVYEAGYVTVPENYKRGALVVLQHNWETRRGTGTVHTGVLGEEERYDHRFSYSIPRKALEWLGAPRPVAA